MFARRLVHLAPLLLAAAACSDSTSPAKSSLESEEAAAVAQYFDASASSGAMTSPALATSSPLAAASPGFSAAMMPVTLSVDHVAPCPKGGQTHLTFALDGQVDQQAHSLDVTMTGTQAPQQCAFPVKDLVFTVTGTPGLTSTHHITIENGVPVGVQTARVEGSFDWSSSDGRSGSCAVDYTSEADFTAGTAKVDGSFCGTTIHYSGPLMHPHG